MRHDEEVDTIISILSDTIWSFVNVFNSKCNIYYTHVVQMDATDRGGTIISNTLCDITLHKTYIAQNWNSHVNDILILNRNHMCPVCLDILQSNLERYGFKNLDIDNVYYKEMKLQRIY